MTQRALELKELLRSTASAIKTSHSSVVLQRQNPWEADGAGGRRRVAGPPTVLAPQQVFKAGQNRTNFPRGTEEGVAREHTFVVIGMPVDAFGLMQLNIEVGDTFQSDNDNFEVYSIHHDRTYQIKALCKVVSS